MRSRKEKKRIRKRGGKRDAYFCIGFSQMWWEKIHSIIKRLLNEHGLKFLPVRIFYHQSPNIRVIPQGDPICKIRKGIVSNDF